MVAKAAIVGATWFLLPLWASFVLALWWYLIPPFRVRMFGGHALGFFALLWSFSAGGSHAFLYALIVGILFFLLVGVKDLLFIAREGLHTLLAFSLIFFVIASFASLADSAGTWNGGGLLWFVVVFLIFLLALGFLRYKFPGLLLVHLVVFSGIIALLVGELGFALLFTPMVAWVRTAAVFAAVFIGMEWEVEYLRSGRVAVPRAMRYAYAFLALLVLLFGITEWTP